MLVASSHQVHDKFTTSLSSGISPLYLMECSRIYLTGLKYNIHILQVIFSNTNNMTLMMYAVIQIIESHQRHQTSTSIPACTGMCSVLVWPSSSSLRYECWPLLGVLSLFVASLKCRYISALLLK